MRLQTNQINDTDRDAAHLLVSEPVHAPFFGSSHTRNTESFRAGTQLYGYPSS